MAKLLWQGHGSFRLRASDGTVVYIDPYAGEGYSLPADGILSPISIDHNKNFYLEKPGCVIFQNFDARGRKIQFNYNRLGQSRELSATKTTREANASGT